MRDAVIKRILDRKLIAIIRGVYKEDALRLAEALYKGGIELIEVTFDQSRPESFADTQEAIRSINEKFKGEVGVGAGTVTSVKLADMAAEAGAKYIIAPDTNTEVIKHTRALGLVSIPGALTPTEITTAHAAGADFIKLFPAAAFGPGYLKAVLAPLNNVKLLAVGGVSDKNVKEFMDAGAVGAGVAGNLVNKKWIAEGRFGDITAAAAEFVKAIED
ncbi:MAG: bifunctional 4-hydroxy-2-oxoglutarate aldolase/2-dehydro-3-deoxy-phosphogluconate aldolase [Bacillota bacterium]|nr:bifunctional 4-hydroxy-2-oxoglutarate aldolase/2-dehydro-3-deoxy-phosphogluconate aldolase [Bacillota bacterium]